VNEDKIRSTYFSLQQKVHLILSLPWMDGTFHL
jgi:hypothetical protein